VAAKGANGIACIRRTAIQIIAVLVFFADTGSGAGTKAGLGITGAALGTNEAGLPALLTGVDAAVAAEGRGRGDAAHTPFTELADEAAGRDHVLFALLARIQFAVAAEVGIKAGTSIGVASESFGALEAGFITFFSWINDSIPANQTSCAQLV